MKRIPRLTQRTAFGGILYLTMALVVVSFSPQVTTAQLPGQALFAVTSTNQLLQFTSAAPGTLTGQQEISGLQANESIVGIDFRPATGQLYALGSSSRLYTLNTQTGVGTVVGTQPLSPTLAGTSFGFDFNPVVDRIRVVSDADQDLRLNPITGAVAAVDGTLTYTNTDTNAGQNPAVAAAAYTNNISGTTSTTLYGIDTNRDVLVIQNPPNAGVLSTVGSLGINVSEVAGFDITPSGLAYAAVTTAGSTTSSLATINLKTGSATIIAAIGGGVGIRAIAAPAPPPAVQLYGLTSGNRLLQFSSTAPGTITAPQAISGLVGGESLVGIDFRPATGQLYALSNGSRLYTIDPTTAAASLIGTQSISPTLGGTAFGIDFNPVPDRIRIVSNVGQNLRVNPANGAAIVDSTLVYSTTDTNVGVTPQVVAAAYTNSFSGTTSTALYVIDAGKDILALQNPPNAGVLSTIGLLGVDASNLSAFDITPAGAAYVAITAPNATSSSLGTIDLATGRVAPIGTIGGGETIIGLAVSPKPRATVYLPIVLRP